MHRLGFWDTVISSVRMDVHDVRDVRPSICACVHSRRPSFNLICLKLCQNDNLYDLGRVRNLVMLGQKQGQKVNPIKPIMCTLCRAQFLAKAHETLSECKFLKKPRTRSKLGHVGSKKAS